MVLEPRPMRGTKLYWWLKYLSGKAPAFDALLSQPHRTIVCDAVMRNSPASVFDFGCGNGANLHLLLQRNPSLSVAGIDPVGHAIWTAQRHVKGSFQIGSDASLCSIRKRFDVALSDAVLFYLPPHRAKAAILHLLQIGRTVVLSTWHGKPAQDGEAWVYDYAKLAHELDATCSIEAFPDGTWKDLRWQRYGAIVTMSR
jgi:SAM-dependent methyltransferase